LIVVSLVVRVGPVENSPSAIEQDTCDIVTAIRVLRLHLRKGLETEVSLTEVPSQVYEVR
jgi:hypothetical protein